MTRLIGQNQLGILFVASLVLFWKPHLLHGDSIEVVSSLEIVRSNSHLELRTSLPPGRHPIQSIVATSNEVTEGFIYTTQTETDGTKVRIFQVRASEQTNPMRQISVRMRSSTQPGYYTLFFELTESGKPCRSAVLRRNCCGYFLEISGDGFAGKTFQGSNLSTLERDCSDAFGEFVSIAHACNFSGLRVELRPIQEPADNIRVMKSRG